MLPGEKMWSLSKDLVFLIMQFLDEEKFQDSLHKLEQESGYFFNVKYFEDKTMEGDWDEVEKYLLGFTKVDDNRYSMKIFFEIRKQKYLEALDKQDRNRALEILRQDLKVFSTFNEDLFKEITQLLALDNFRENEQLSKYSDSRSARTVMLIVLKKLIEANPVFRDKLVFPPALKPARLRTLVNQSLNWQHQLCRNQMPNPEIKTLFKDHKCEFANGTCEAATVNLPAIALAKPAAYAVLGSHGPVPPATAVANANALAGWIASATASSSLQSPVATGSAVPALPNQVSSLKRPRTPPNAMGMIDYQTTDREQVMKRTRSAAQPHTDEVTYPAPHHLQSRAMDDLPRTVVCTFNQGSNATSIDFHPSHHTLVVVGSVNGETILWEIGLREKLVSKPFKIWDMATLSNTFQALFSKDPSMSISRVRWSPDGNVMGVAFTKHLVHLYGFQGPSDLRHILEFDAHAGGVNDLAFCYPNTQLCVVTGGDDKQIKVWDLNGRKMYNFEGHSAPVYSVCPHHKDGIQFIFSTDTDGEIKAWLYDGTGSRVDYNAPGHGYTRMLYSADGTRLFSCGTSKDGESNLVEWNETEGAIRRTYSGLRTKSSGVVQFDLAQNHLLAAGEDHQIKFWDMENINILTSTEAEGGLPSLPLLRFNKEGSLLAVSTADNGFRILANSEGLRSLRALESRSLEVLRGHNEPPGLKILDPSAAAMLDPANFKLEQPDRSSPARPSTVCNGVDPTIRTVEKSRIVEETSNEAKAEDLAEIVDPSSCRVVTIPASVDPASTDPASKVARLLYTNSGSGILVLESNGPLKLWKWSHSERNPSGKATASVDPQHWQPNNGLCMTNDVSDVNLEEAVPCIALSKNDSYILSACGGKVSLFNMMNFKVMTTFMPLPPAPTFLAFHPHDNNIIAIGMEDSTIHIFNVRVDEVKSKLKGHQKRIASLAFSAKLNILVSSGADAQLCTWTTDTWEKRKAVTVQVPSGKVTIGDTRVQFHSDQIRLLVFHETQLAIYDASKMECIQQWIPHEVLPAQISYAAHSCNSELIYAAFCDGNLGVFDAESLRLRCCIAPSAYLSQAALNRQNVRPLVIATHPLEPNQLAIGLTDGTVKVLEPLESDGRWAVRALTENGIPNGTAATSSGTGNRAPEQLQR